ncbi:MAG TPA: hypothetical protein VL359_19900, partial [bacterium]|nr:hypothetical protein [bacterium]
MPEFLVRWEIDMEADTVQQAALEARRIQLDPDSLASIFEVQEESGEWFCLDLPLGSGVVPMKGLEP